MTSTTIHPTAIVEDGAQLGSNVSVGPFCVIGSEVVLGDNIKVVSHSSIVGKTTVGEGTQIFPFSSLGHQPQDLKYHGEPSTLVIGKNNMIREHVTMNPGTEGGGMQTTVGDNCLFMVGSHVAHDCHVGNNVILANNATLAGHVTVEDFVIIGGLSAVRQFVRIGAHAMIGGMSGIENDVIPYGQAVGERAGLVGLNLIGLKRRGFERQEIHSLRSAYRLLFSPEGTLAERVEDAKERFADNDAVMEVIEFISGDEVKAICQPKNIVDRDETAAG